jgi:hypothetical protein
MTPPLFCDYLPFEVDLALYLNNLEFPLPKDHYAKFDCNWPAGSGEEDFFNINIVPGKYGFPYCSPSRPLKTMM